MKLNVNKGSASTTLTIRLSVEDRDYLTELAYRKRMNVNAYVRSHLLDFLSREAVKDWARDEMAAITGSLTPQQGNPLPVSVMEAIFASYHMLFDIVDQRDPKASKRAIELGQRDAAHEFRNSTSRGS
jgi:predicted transcriptional regulator